MEEKIREAFREFDAIMSKFGEYGAHDTEPRYIMRYTLRIHFGFENSKNPDWWPVTGHDWELYTASMKCERAARSLTSGLKKLFKKLHRLSINASARSLIKEYLY